MLRRFDFVRSLLCLAALAVAPLPVAAAGLVARYDFDSCTAADTSGTGNGGTIVNAHNVACVPGVRGTALAFPGLSTPAGACNWSYVTAPPSDGYGAFNDFGMHSIFAKSGDREGLLARTVRNPGEDGLHVVVHSGCLAAPCSGSAVLTPGTVNLGDWHMLTVTNGGGSVRVYLDGALQNEMPTAAFGVNPTMPAKPLQLGVDQLALWYPIDGSLDEVCVHRRALAPEEVGAAFAARTCDVVPVAVDVRPGFATNLIVRSPLLPVVAAILGSPSLDVASVNRATVVLAGAPVALTKKGVPEAVLLDVNRDGILDLVALFPSAAMVLPVGNGVANLTRELSNGTAIFGQDAVRVLR